MIKRTMYFYDKKQADLIKKVNDKLHKQRGVKVGDGYYNKVVAGEAYKIIKNLSNSFIEMANRSKEYSEKNQFKEAAQYITTLFKLKDNDYPVENILNGLQNLKITNAPRVLLNLKTQAIEKLKNLL